MQTITVTALQDQEYRGRRVSVGEMFDVAPIDAAALRYQRKAALPSDGARVAQALRTRDLRAEPPAPPTRRRRYRRRDLTADLS